MNIPLPRLLDDQLRQRAMLHPVRLSISLNLAPLSTAQMTLPSFDAAAQPGDYVELFTSMGSAGVFRVQKIERDHQGLRTVHLEHGLVSLADSLISSAGEEEGAPLDILGQLMSHQASPARWQLGRVEVPAGKLLTWKWDYSNVLESLLGLMRELPDYALAFDQRATPWTLNIIACTDQAACECRLNRNLLGLKVTVDRTELCTRLYIPPPDPEDEDAEPQEPVILNADTQSTWGIVSRSLSGDPGLTQEELLAEGRHYLELHKEPLISVSMDARDLSATSGQSFDRFTLGRVCRVCLPAQKETIRQRIVSIAWPDVYRKPDQITITLANKTSTAGSILSGLIVDTTVLRKRVTKNWNTLQEQEYVLIQAKKNITLLSEEIDLIGKDITLQAEEIELLAREIALKASQSVVDGMGARISEVSLELDAAQTSLLAKAERTEVNDLTTRVSSAELYLFGAEGQAGLVTKVAENDDLLSQVRLDLDAAQTALSAKAERSELQDLTTRVTSAELYLFGADGQAGLVTKVAENGELIGQARLDLDAVQETATLLTGQIDDQGDLLDGAILRLDGLESDILMQADTIRQKADLILLDGYVKVTELAAANAAISNLTSGLTTATVLRATLLTGNEVNTTYGSFSSLTHAGSLVSQRKVTMGTISTIGSALSTGGELDLQHSHKIVDNGDGTFTLGEAASTGGSFNIADTLTYKNGVSAAYGNGYNVGFADGKDAYLPTAINRTGYDTTAKTVTVRALNSHQDLLTGVAIDASEIYEAGRTFGRSEMGIIRDGDTVTVGVSGTKSMRAYVHDTHYVIKGSQTNLTPGTLFTGSAGAYYYGGNIALGGSAAVWWE